MNDVIRAQPNNVRPAQTMLARAQDQSHGFVWRITDEATSEALTLERVVNELARQTNAVWVSELRDRYLAWDKIDALLAG